MTQDTQESTTSPAAVTSTPCYACGAKVLAGDDSCLVCGAKRRNELEVCCELVIAESLSTGHAETHSQLMLEVLEQYNELLAKHQEMTHRLESWLEAYPLEIFPEPNMSLVRECLKEGGHTLDAVSASNMRHVLNGVAGIIGSKVRK